LDASGPAFSPAEDDLIFFAFVQVPGGSRYPVYRVGADGSSLVELSPPGASVGNAQWSPDGSMIAYSTCCSEVGAADEIHVVNEDGSDDRVLVTDSDSGNRESSLSLFPFSPEGTTIAFEDYAYNEDNFRPIYNRISTVDLAGSVAIHSTDPDVFFQQWSADGSRFVACEFSNEGIEGALSFALGQATGVDLLPVCDLDWDRRDNPYGP
ncbi:MAG: TolB family protein, partial [Actinomycetota bacterium]